MSELVLVTGAGGYLAMQITSVFLNKGYKVRGTVRSFSDKKKIDALRSLAGEDRLELVEADLLDENAWPAALKDVTLVCHVASPFPSNSVQDENILIKPALNGTLNVLNAAFDAKTVKRLVLTSSTIAILGYTRDDRVYTELDWPDPAKQLAYGKSKILAEKAAWDFVAERKKNGQSCFELTVINPSFILGPTFHCKDTILGTSESRILQLLDGTAKKIPRLNVGVCDVRDVALAHFKAAFLSEAVGNRHAILSQPNLVSFKEMADILHEEFGPKGYKIPREEDSTGNDIPLSKASVDNSRMLNVLKISPFSLRQTLIDMANSLIENGLVTIPKP